MYSEHCDLDGTLIYDMTLGEEETGQEVQINEVESSLLCLTASLLTTTTIIIIIVIIMT